MPKSDSQGLLEEVYLGDPKLNYHTPGLGASVLYMLTLLTSCGHADKLRLRKPRVLLALVQILLTCVPFQIVSNCYAKIFDIFYVIKDSSL